MQGPSAALLDKVRALDALPRLGALRTLDLKGNDLRVRSRLDCLKNNELSHSATAGRNYIRSAGPQKKPDTQGP